MKNKLDATKEPAYTVTNISFDGSSAKVANDVFDIIEDIKEQKKADSYNIQYLPLDVIVINPLNEIYRKITTQQDIRLLADTIKVTRTIDALHVIPNPDDTHRIVSGENRLLALKLLRDEGDDIYPEGVPAVVLSYKMSSMEERIRIHAENLAKRHYNDVTYVMLLADFEGCLRQIEKVGGPKIRNINMLLSSITGLSKRNIRRVRALYQKLTENLFNDLISERINQTDAEEYIQMDAEDQELIHQEVMKGNKVNITDLRIYKARQKAEDQEPVKNPVQDPPSGNQPDEENLNENSYIGMITARKNTAAKDPALKKVPEPAERYTGGSVMEQLRYKRELYRALERVQTSIANYLEKEKLYFSLYGEYSDNYQEFIKIIEGIQDL